MDCVLWVKADEVVANDYNPNVMAPGEKKLLKQSLEKMVSPTRGGVGGEEPIWWWMVSSSVTGQGSRYRKTPEGWLPVACINPERKGQATRMAATIQHNQAG